MKNKKVVVFVIINIILIGIICSLISIKKNLIKEKQVIKEMSESTQISDLQNQINQLNASQEEYAKNIQSYKAKLATAITNQKVTTSENATIDEMVTNIGNILQARTNDATATADNITAGKTAYVNGKLITGNGADNNSYYNQGITNGRIGYYSQSQYDNHYLEGYNLGKADGVSNVNLKVIRPLSDDISLEYGTYTYTFTENIEKGILVYNIYTDGGRYVNSPGVSTSIGITQLSMFSNNSNKYFRSSVAIYLIENVIVGQTISFSQPVNYGYMLGVIKIV